MTSKFKVTLCRLPLPPPPPSSLSPDSVWHSVGLVAVALAVSGVLRPAGGPLVPPQSHRPVGEHRDTFGNAPAGLGKEQCETETVGHFQKVFFDTAEVREIFGTVRVLRCLNKCTYSDKGNATRLKVNSSELV